MGAWLPACRMSATTVWSARSLEGNWSYEPAGLLDETHLHFFTRRDMVDLFERAGFEIVDMQVVPGPGYEEWRQSGCPDEVRVGRLHIAGTAPEEAEEFFVYQYLLVAQPRELKRTATPTRATSNSPTIAASGRLPRAGPVASCVQEKPFRVMTKSEARRSAEPRRTRPDAADLIPRQFRSGLVDRTIRGRRPGTRRSRSQSNS